MIKERRESKNFMLNCIYDMYFSLKGIVNNISFYINVDEFHIRHIFSLWIWRLALAGIGLSFMGFPVTDRQHCRRWGASRVSTGNSVSGGKLPELFFFPAEKAAVNPITGGNFRRKISAGNKIPPENFPLKCFRRKFFDGMFPPEIIFIWSVTWPWWNI